MRSRIKRKRILKDSNRPKSGWDCCEIFDAKDNRSHHLFRCDFCNKKLRWVHVLKHKEYHGNVHAGCICATRLCDNYDAEAAEVKMKNRMIRKKNFLMQSKWRISGRNRDNILRDLNLKDGKKIRVTIFLMQLGYKVFLAGPGEQQYCPNDVFESQGTAMELAFEIIDELKNSTN